MKKRNKAEGLTLIYIKYYYNAKINFKYFF